MLIFYNRFQKKIEVKYEDIYNVESIETRLNHDIMEFILYRVQLIYLKCYYREIHIIRSYVC